MNEKEFYVTDLDFFSWLRCIRHLRGLGYKIVNDNWNTGNALFKKI